MTFRMRPGSAAPTLRTRLLHRLAWPLLAVLMLSAVYDFVQARQRAVDNQDLALVRVAIALASRLDVDADDARDDDLGVHLSRTMAAMQRADRRDRLHFAVRADGAGLIGGDLAVLALADVVQEPGPEDASNARYADHTLAGQPVRVVTWPHRSPLGPVTVVVAETTQRRAAEARVVLADALWPNLLLMGMAVWLVQRGVRAAMAPLDRLDRAVAERDRDDLSPLPDTALPGELQPLVQAINRLMAHLRAAVQAQQAFLSNAAHQLRTPLAALQTQLALDTGHAPVPGQARLHTLAAAVQRLTRLTHQMLALARSGPEAVQATDFAEVDLRQLLEEAASTWLDTALAANVDLGFDAQAATILGSAWMLQELLGNLIDNAIRHSPPQGAVTVRCGVDGQGCAWLAVDDGGPGIAPAMRSRVFERFFRAPGSPPGGAGLGLAIVREVAQRHRAEVLMDDAPDGQGLRVLVRWPP